MIVSLWTRGRSCYLFLSLVQSMAFHEAYFARPSLLNRRNNLALSASPLQPEDRAEFSKDFARYTLFALGAIQAPPDAIATTPNTLVRMPDCMSAMRWNSPESVRNPMFKTFSIDCHVSSWSSEVSGEEKYADTSEFDG